MKLQGRILKSHQDLKKLYTNLQWRYDNHQLPYFPEI